MPDLRSFENFVSLTRPEVDEILGFLFRRLLRMFSQPIYTGQFVKVTLKNTRILFYLSIANILVCAVLFIFFLAGIRPSFINILLWEYCVVLILTLFYFVRMLLYFNEATSVVAAFTMFTCILAFSAVSILLPHLLNATYSGWLGTLSEVISLLVAFRSFFIQAAPLRLPFRLFGAGVALLALPRMFALLVATSFNDELVGITGDLGAIVILGSTVFILKKMMDFLKNDAARPVETADEQS